ncbi:ABC-type glycerol-3-phosphate transport system, substrate-binding protein [Streptomyces sp. MnatMP-M17]|uniref:ABC transporter substrate-binding protein n=1 Tax=Streptomyces sp. MnatMP-M17 TaxID=1839780 RepID=UPI00081EA2F7|nr:extracellular solute-binding protein [Streptomyces sp. SID4917]SCF78965.1 ABC-type glycerol-3-phosphate transport system, substrate-binding protein [Streptomyces sp. MnatMP-M17]
MVGTARRHVLGLAVAAPLSLVLAGCGGSPAPSGVGKDGVVTISVNGMPAKTQPADRKDFEELVKEFEASHPKIRIDAREGQMDPKTFAAKLAGGQLEDVFYVYFTDPAGLIQRRQAADITPYLKDVPYLQDVRPELQDVFKDADGRIYGLPTGNYSLGLVYNRALFTKAGLDPDRPPATWDEVRTAAGRISALGDGTVGYADYSKNNQGGWHLTSWIYSMGGEVATRGDDGRWKAAFNSAAGHKALQALHDMRWTDNSMGTRQLLEIGDVQKMMGSGKLGMYMAGPDNIPTIVKQFEREYEEFGLAALPGTATLGGGDGFMFNPKASPEKIKAGLQWVQWKYLNPDREEKNAKKWAGQGIPIGLPQPNLFRGEAQAKNDAIHAKYANVPQRNFKPFVDRSPQVAVKIEPPNAQQLYTVLDGVMQSVLTKKDANLDQLLATAEKKADAILATVR